MLKGIPKVLPPELLKILMEMGHGDYIVLADGNFPGAALAQRLVRCDGHGVPEILDAVLKLMPLDPYVEKPVSLMEVVPGDNVVPVIWDTYRDIVKKYEPEKENFDYRLLCGRCNYKCQKAPGTRGRCAYLRSASLYRRMCF